MKLKLFKKYFLTTALIILSSLVVIMVILTFVLNNYIAKERHLSLSKACNEVSVFLSDESVEKAEQIDSVLSTVAEISGADIFIADADRSVQICSCGDFSQNGNCLHTDKKIKETEIEKALKSDKLLLTTLGLYKTPHYVTAISVQAGENYFTVFAGAPISSSKEIIAKVSNLYLLSAVIPMLIMFFAIYAMTYRMTKPIKHMSEASRLMARGDFSKRIPVTTDDEIGELAAAFNMMTNNLASLEGMRKSFVANVSHELKTPMTTIGGFIDGILDGTIPPDKQSYYLGIVSEEVKRLSRLVNSMLSMSKLESGELALNYEQFDLRELIFTTVISQEQRIETQKLNIEGLDELEAISINADKDLMHQVIYNLVDNAIKFTDEGGKLSFKLTRENKKTVFILTNSGVGIPQKDIKFVFERFYKVDKSRSAAKNSTGIGLYIVKTIVKAHGGTIMVSSKENEFTSFKLILPEIN